MQDLLNNIKTLIPIAAVLIAIAGFYYTTQSRLDILESDVIKLQKQVKKITRQSKK